MSYHLEKLTNEPIVLNVLHADCRLSVEGRAILAELLPLLEAQRDPVYLILDSSAMAFDVTEILQGTALVARYYEVFKHPQVRELISVIEKPFLKAAAEALSNPRFGGVKVHIVPSLDAGLAYARTQIAEARS